MKFYIDYDEIDKTWDVKQEEEGDGWGIFLFSCLTKQDAEDAVKLLNGLLAGGMT